MKTLVITTNKGLTKTYVMTPTSQGYNVQKVTGFLGSKTLVGHGSSLENAFQVARMDCGDSGVRSTKLHG
jgi:hypothetical protein